LASGCASTTTSAVSEFAPLPGVKVHDDSRPGVVNEPLHKLDTTRRVWKSESVTTSQPTNRVSLRRF
jgi:hypothetical protein